MSYFFDSALSKHQDCFLCVYSNPTRKTQIVRITNLPNLRLEKVAFAGDRILFLGIPQAMLEVHTYTDNTSILEGTIPCQDLRILDKAGSILAQVS
jgi:Domain of unknown function (DUF1830)